MQSDEMIGTESGDHGTEEEHGDGEEHIHLPPSSIWPITMAAGITTFGAGFVTNFPAALGGGLVWPISVAGVAIMVIALIGWVQELRHEPH